MKIIQLRLENYRRHRSTQLEFPDGLTTLLGRNGSGKSSLLEAIGFALFGVPATRTNKTLIRWDGAAPSDPVRVQLQFEMHGQAVDLVRELRGKDLSPSASLSIDGQVQVAPGASSNAAVTREVERLIGMPRDAFFTTVVARQKELARLSDQAPEERKRLILTMMGVDSLDRAIAEARRRAKDASIRVEALRETLPDRAALEAQAADATQAIRDAESERQASVKQLEKARQDLAQKESERVEVTAELARLQANQRDHDAATKALADLDKRLAVVAKDVQAARAAKTDVERLEELATREPADRKALANAEAGEQAKALRASIRNKLARLQKERTALQVEAPNGELTQARESVVEIVEKTEAMASDWRQAQATLSLLNDRLERLVELDSDAQCPTCESPLSHIDGVKAHLETEASEVSRRAAALKQAYDAADVERQAKARRVTELEQQAQQAERAMEQAKRIDEAVREGEAELAALPLEVDADIAVLQQAAEASRRAAAELAAANVRAERLPKLLDDAAVLQQQRDTLSQNRPTAPEAGAMAVCESMVREVATAVTAMTRVVEQSLKQQHEAATRYELAVVKERDLAARIAEAKEAEVRLKESQTDARLWTALAGGRGRGILEAFRAHVVAKIGPAVSEEASRLLERFTHGRYREVLLDPNYELYVTDGGRRYTLDRFSGGESDLVHLALRLAVSRLLQQNTEIRFLALDEVFGSLDEERRDHVLGALQELGGLYSQVLLVTHQQGLRDALDRAIMVEEVDGEAVVSVHNG